MSFTAIPFIVGGLGLLGFSAGIFARRLKLRPFFSAVLAWCVQAPYVFATDYAWFAYTKFMPPPVALATVTTILIKLMVEAIVASALVEVLVPYIKRSGLTFQ